MRHMRRLRLIIPKPLTALKPVKTSKNIEIIETVKNIKIIRNYGFIPMKR